ncbi:MAG TPA: right-handed parallel beta-helix repeat-containing protein [Actinomycetota bacterium]|nr:right-handed parallel beta-helix repeat-containing protein [Actinomycetota bacterium]
MRAPAPAFLALALGLAPSLAPASAGAGEILVTALDDTFQPEIVQIPLGTTVVWTHQGKSPHTITADDGSFDSGPLGEGDRFSFTFEEPGTHAYHCLYHGGSGGRGMAGVVRVGSTGANDEPEQPQSLPPLPGETLRVPSEHPTIQAAVDAADPGDLVLVGPGVYTEAVEVTTPFLTIRGSDRNRVILDGDFRLPAGVRVLEADGVTIENLTARHYLLNGFYWARVDGYRGSYLTASNNGNYGIYVIDSVHGQFDHSYASGHPDSGFYVGQCQPCHAVVTDVLAERNAIGYSGTNAGGDLTVTRSEWRHNMAGLVPNTLDSELYPPQRGVTITGNWVHDNNNVDAPAKELTYPAFGHGILISGGADNLVLDNRVEDHETFGIAVTMIVDRNYWFPEGNRILGNVVRRSGIADLALGGPASGGNCFGDNSFGVSLPPAIETLYGCAFAPTGGAGGDLGVTATLAGRVARAASGDFPHGQWRTQPAPPPQPNMPDASAAPPSPAVDLPDPVGANSAPQAPRTATDGAVSQEVTVLGSALAAPTWWALSISLYAYLLPLALYAAWLAVAFWDLARRDDMSLRARTGWMAAVLLIPLLGPVAYYVVGRSPIPGAIRLTMVAGGMVAYAVFATISYVLASR